MRGGGRGVGGSVEVGLKLGTRAVDSLSLSLSPLDSNVIGRVGCKDGENVSD